jgi:hypothetical protein
MFYQCFVRLPVLRLSAPIEGKKKNCIEKTRVDLARVLPAAPFSSNCSMCVGQVPGSGGVAAEPASLERFGWRGRVVAVRLTPLSYEL